MLTSLYPFRNYIVSCRHDRLPGQTLKRKKYIFASIVLICTVFDWLLLWCCREAFFTLLYDAPYLPAKYTHEYTHLKTLRTPAAGRDREDLIISIAFSPDNKTLAAAAGKSIHFWDVKTGAHLSALKTDLRNVGAVAFSPEEKTVASISSRDHWKNIDILDLRDILFVSSRESERLSPFAQEMFIDYTVEMWDTKTGKKLWDFPAATVLLKALDFSPDSGKLHLTTYAGLIEVYDAITGEHLLQRQSVLAKNVMANTYGFRGFGFSPDGKIFASGGRNRIRHPVDVAHAEIQLWDIDTGLLLQTLKSPGERTELLAFSPDSKILASTCDDVFGNLHPDKIYIWDVKSQGLFSIINTSEIGETRIRTLRFAPDNITLASGHTGGRIHLWDITGQTKSK